eukprot:CAMPEP_0119034486 /NCGR_PEP_ID=MMETSP1177-20130426/1473_1 /TAXON_ID=2985 /ORGANISM="Ochromonas sp, Strain CCMP1899" /LENGTH=295 /DNA_ID=CAMNT_0006991947 /DNA_START=355 /DNA_END=1239 /DNA_ORIENTATION=+
MNKRYDDWRDESLAQLRVLSNDQLQQRIQMELSLEITPRDSRYSPHLVSLMKAEEDTTGKEKSSITSELNRKVDEALAQETHKFFEKTAFQNLKKWKSLCQKLDSEREKYRIIVSDQVIKNTGNSNGIYKNENEKMKNEKNEKIFLTVADLDDESVRLEEEYNRNFLHYEGFHLVEAFKSQASKVDKDWAVHESALEDDYRARRKGITGSDELKSAQVIQQHEENRWQHPEKQKTLIHTAPVFVPQHNSSGSTHKGSGNRKEDNAKSNKELERLDYQYSFALESLSDQKSGALRW